MTGGLVWERDGAEPHHFDRVIIHLRNGKLAFRDQRKLDGLWIAENDDDVREIIGDQGSDALV